MGKTRTRIYQRKKNECIEQVEVAKEGEGKKK